MSQLDQLLAGDEIGAAAARKPKAPGSTPTSGPTKNLRKVYAGIPPTDVAIGATVDVNCPVLEPFRMDQPILAPTAQVLLVGNIRVGTKPLNVSPNPISGNAFSEQALNSVLSGYTAQPGTGITITVTNKTAAIVNIQGGFIGWAAL